MNMEVVSVADMHQGILCGDERRYHVNASSMGLVFPFPPIIVFRGRQYVAHSTTTNKAGEFLKIVYKSDGGYEFVVHNNVIKG